VRRRGGPGFLFIGRRILGVRAQDGRFAGDLGGDAARLLREVDGGADARGRLVSQRARGARACAAGERP
jgi:hypothetical protein